MNQSQIQVKQFHKKFGLVINSSPTLPDAKTLALRVALINEEAKEFQDAAAVDENKVGAIAKLTELADALGDLLYVVYGTGVSLGIDLEPVVSEIHASNMTKVWKGGTVRRREDGKVMKPPYYKPADVEGTLRAQLVPTTQYV